MAGESISIPILTPGADAAARNIKQVGNAAAETGGKLDFAALSLKAFNDAAGKSAKADATAINAMKAHAKATSLLADAENVLAGKATTTTKLFADQQKKISDLQKKMDDTGKSAAGLAARFSGLAGGGGGGIAAGGGMGLLIGAGVTLAGQISTLAFGLGGLGLAAYGVAKPIEKAAQATGGLQKNLHTLNPQQQAVAKSLLGLEHQYDAFQKSLQPQILTAFNNGFRIAGQLMHDIQPIAKATGTALNQVLVSVGKEFQSGTWQQFFRWMAQQAAPDMRQLGQTFTDLLNTLPPLIQDLNPLGKGLLLVADDAVKAVDAVSHFYSAFQRNVPISNQHTLSFLQQLDRWTVNLTNHLGPWARAINNAGTSAQHSLGDQAAPAFSSVSGAASTAGKNLITVSYALAALSKSWAGTPAKAAPATDAITRMADAAQATFAKAGPATDAITRLASSSQAAAGHVTPLTDAITMTAKNEEAAFRHAGPLTDAISRLAIPAKAAAVKLTDIANAVKSINTQETTSLTNMTTYAGDLVTTANDADALRTALKKSHDEIGLHTQIQRNSFAAANTYITDLGNTAKAAYDSGHGVDASITAIKKGLPILDQAKTKNKAYWSEVKTLVGWLDRLRLEKAIHENVYVSGSGTFTVRPGSSLGLPGGTAGGPFAAGGRVPGSGSGDTYPAMLTPGEAVVPKRLVPAVAPFLSANSVPGFAAGGIVGSYSGPVAGLVPWSKHDLNATVGIFESAIAKATLNGIKAASFAGSTGGHPLSGAGIYSQPALESLWIGAGGPAGLAHLMAAIADAESGGNPNAYNASGASGLWQILGQIVPGNIFNPVVNAENAVAKWRTQGLGAWVTYTSGAYRQYYDQGGYLQPGWTMAYNGTGRPEQVIPNRGSGTHLAGQTVVVNVQLGHGTHPVAAAQEIAKVLNVGARNGVRLRTSILGPG